MGKLLVLVLLGCGQARECKVPDYKPVECQAFTAVKEGGAPDCSVVVEVHREQGYKYFGKLANGVRVFDLRRILVGDKYCRGCAWMTQE